jgi:type I restriction enzyme S subunit
MKLESRPSLHTVQFSEIAFNISQRIDPGKSEAEIYVGLEHIDPQDIHIHRYGHPSDVKGTKLKVSKGDVIFGKRRAYQRKAAVAGFNGICSAHAMVLRANPESILPELLPFLLHTDEFMDRAVKISEGSLSPTIKWSVLAKQEFEIPNLEEQERVLSVLLRSDEMIMKRKKLLDSLKDLRTALLGDIFSSAEREISVENLPIEFQNGLWESKSEDKVSARVIRNTEFSINGVPDIDSSIQIYVDKKQLEPRLLRRGDIVIEMSGGSPSQPVGRVVYIDQEVDNLSYSNFTKRLRLAPGSAVSSEYLFYFLQYYYERGGTRRLQKQTTGIINLDIDLYKKIKVPITDKNQQDSAVSKIRAINSLLSALHKQVSLDHKLQNKLSSKLIVGK